MLPNWQELPFTYILHLSLQKAQRLSATSCEIAGEKRKGSHLVYFYIKTLLNMCVCVFSRIICTLSSASLRIILKFTSLWVTRVFFCFLHFCMLIFFFFFLILHFLWLRIRGMGWIWMFWGRPSLLETARKKYLLQIAVFSIEKKNWEICCVSLVSNGCGDFFPEIYFMLYFCKNECGGKTLLQVQTFFLLFFSREKRWRNYSH